MTATLSAFLSARKYAGKVKKSTIAEEESYIESIMPMLDESSNTFDMRRRLPVLPRDERPLQPQRSSSNIMDTRGHYSESRLGRKEAPLAPRTFSRLHSDNFLYSSDLAHVRENAKQLPRPVTRKKSFNSGSTARVAAATGVEDSGSWCPFEETSADDDDSVDDISIDTHESDDDEVVISKRPGPQRRLLRSESSSFYHNAPRPAYHDRWNAAFGGTAVDNRRGRSRSRHSRLGPPRSARRLDSISREDGRRQHRTAGCEQSIGTTSSSITTVSTISGVSAPIEKFASDALSTGTLSSLEPSTCSGLSSPPTSRCSGQDIMYVPPQADAAAEVCSPQGSIPPNRDLLFLPSPSVSSKASYDKTKPDEFKPIGGCRSLRPTRTVDLKATAPPGTHLRPRRQRRHHSMHQREHLSSRSEGSLDSQCGFDYAASDTRNASRRMTVPRRASSSKECRRDTLPQSVTSNVRVNDKEETLVSLSRIASSREWNVHSVARRHQKPGGSERSMPRTIHKRPASPCGKLHYQPRMPHQVVPLI